MNYSNNVTFAFRKTLEREALAAIPGLPLILEGHYGPKIWTWFTQSARDETEGYKWDPEQGLVEKQEIVHYTKLTGWEDLEEDLNDSTTPPATQVHGFEIVTDNLGQNQYQDDGTIKTKHFQVSTQQTGNNSEPEDPTTAITNLLHTNPSMSAQLMTFIRNMTAEAEQNQQEPPSNDDKQAEPQPDEHPTTATISPTKDANDDSMDVDQE